MSAAIVALAAIGALAFLLAALVPLRKPKLRTTGRVLAVLGALALLPSVGSSGAWPFVLLAAGAAALATPLPLVLAAAGAVMVALQPETSAPIAAAVAGLAVAAAADGLVSWLRARRAQGADALGPALVAGALLVLVLVRVDHGAVLSWTFGVAGETGRVVLRGVGVALGVTLVAALGGVLLLTTARLAPEASGARPVAVGALSAAVLAAVLGAGLTVARLTELPAGVGESGARSLVVLVAAVGTLAASLLDATGPATPGPVAPLRRTARVTGLAAALALGVAVAAGVESWWREATYATPLTTAAAAAALLGLAVLEPEARLAGTRRVLFLAALLFLLVA
ncbi:MAG: hypothetical protein LJF15_15320 [Acidobacteria bacterium]|nr:hypothetical protein [Acidobacteriota bacterium]